MSNRRYLFAMLCIAFLACKREEAQHCYHCETVVTLDSNGAIRSGSDWNQCDLTEEAAKDLAIRGTKRKYKLVTSGDTVLANSVTTCTMF